MKVRYLLIILLQYILIFTSYCSENCKSICDLREKSDIQYFNNLISIGCDEKGIEVNSADVSLDTTTKYKVTNFITEFYKSYISETSSFSIENFLTKRLLEKIGRMGVATGADPIIRAQDTTNDMLRTLTVRDLGDFWYMVSYTSNKGTQYERIKNIPLKIVKINERFKIDYITPERHDTLYGDRLICEYPKISVIETSDPLEFLKSFYGVYAMEYGSMPEALMDKLSLLRAKYLTPKALTQLKKAADDQGKDGWAGYDLLIDDFDYDWVQYPSMKIIKLDEETYQMQYKITESYFKRLELKVIKQGEQYRIDSIGIKEDM